MDLINIIHCLRREDYAAYVSRNVVLYENLLQLNKINLMPRATTGIGRDFISSFHLLVSQVRMEIQKIKTIKKTYTNTYRRANKKVASSRALMDLN